MNMTMLFPLADVAQGPTIATIVAIPLLAIAVILIAAALLIKAVRKRREK